MKFLIYLLYLISCFILSAGAWGADAVTPIPPASMSQSVKAEADQIEYDQDLGIIRLAGHVKVHYGNRLFESESAVFYTKSNVLSTDKDYSIYEDNKLLVSGKSASYNILESAISSMGGYTQITNDDKILYLKAKNITNASNAQILYDAEATLCNRIDKDYRITATKVIYNTSTKNATLENATIFLGNTPIFYLPSITTKLREAKKNKKPRELFPVITSTLQRGTAVKVDLFDMLDLVGLESPKGDIVFAPYITSYSKIGWGGGANVYYTVSNNDYLELAADYKNDVGLNGGIIYARDSFVPRSFLNGPLTVYADRRDIRNGVSFDNYFTYYNITELPYIVYSNGHALGETAGVNISTNYSLGYGSFNETLIGSVGAVSPSVMETKTNGIAGLSFNKPVYSSPNQSLSYTLGLSENYSAYSGGKSQSSANLSNTIDYSLYFLTARVSLVSLNQAGFSPFAFDRRSTNDKYLVTGGKIALGNDFYIPWGYNKNLDNNTDTLIMYGLYYETDCLKFGFKTNTVAQDLTIDLLIKGL